MLAVHDRNAASLMYAVNLVYLSRIYHFTMMSIEFRVACLGNLGASLPVKAQVVGMEDCLRRPEMEPYLRWLLGIISVLSQRLFCWLMEELSSSELDESPDDQEMRELHTLGLAELHLRELLAQLNDIRPTREDRDRGNAH
jgi:hypothetical protein